MYSVFKLDLTTFCLKFSFLTFVLFRSCCLCLSLSSSSCSVLIFSLLCREQDFNSSELMSTRRKEKGVEALPWEVGREDSVSCVFIMLMLSDSLTGELVQSSAVISLRPLPLCSTSLCECLCEVCSWQPWGCTLIYTSTWQMERTDLRLALYPSLLLSVCLMLGSDWLYLSQEFEEIAHIYRVCAACLPVCR